MEIIVGRKGQQPFEITDKSVSGKHLKLITMSDGNILMEDLGSSNGTFINGVRIIKKVVSRDTIVQMGQNYKFKIGDVLPEVCKVPVVQQQSNPTLPKPVEEFSISHLENVWNQYSAAKDELENQNRNIGLMRSATPVLNVIPGLGAVLGAYSFYKAKKFNYKEALNEVQETFENNYVCPKCHHYLGVIKYKLLIQDSNCRYCKCKWTI